MRRKDIAAFFGILCYTLTVFAGLYVYYTKTTIQVTTHKERHKAHAVE